MTTPAPRVVIAEDEALIRLDLAEMLEEEGYAVVGQAEDGERAVALAEELRPDLVILDIKMPRLDGIAAAEPGRRAAAARERGQRARGTARDAQGGRPRQGRAAGAAGPQRARVVPLDPEDGDGPATLHARGRGGRGSSRCVR